MYVNPNRPVKLAKGNPETGSEPEGLFEKIKTNNV